jgi:hypothetical protein
MRRVWERKGPRERAISPPVGSVLRDFHMAIRAGHEADAVAVLALLQEEYHLDAINLLFLRVELLASFRRWAALLDLPEMPDLLRLRRPVAVTEALIRPFIITSWFRSKVQPTHRGCEKNGTGTFATADFRGFSPLPLGASPIFLQPHRGQERHSSGTYTRATSHCLPTTRECGPRRH